MATQPVGLLTQYVDLMNQGFTPEQIRQQIDEQRAMQFAQLRPEEKISYNLARGAGQLGRGLSSLFGVEQQDPAMQMATQMRQLQSQFDTTTAEGMMQYARALQSINPQMAQQAALAARKMEQEEARVGLTRAQTSEVTSRAGREARLAEESAAKATKEQEALKGRAAALRKRFPEMTEEESETLAADPAVVRELIKPVKVDGKTVKPKIVTAGGRVLLINEETGETIKDIGAAGKTLEESLGTGLGMLAGVMGKKQAETAGAEGGKEVGKAIGQIQGKEDAISAVRSALDLVDKGIYAGGYGPMQEAVAKFTPLGSKGRLTNTEQFRATIGEVVIPRLQEFGGNDSVEELKYLRSVVAGETTLEPAAIKRILQQAERKIQRGIQRIQSQQQAVQEGKPLPTGVAGQRKPVDWNSLK